MILKNKNIIFKIRRSNVTDYAALRSPYGKQCSVDDQTAPIGAVCSGSKLFASILNSSLMLGNYLQQTTSIVHFFSLSWRFKR